MPHCGSNWMPKDGHSDDNQTYRCGDCKYRCTTDSNRHCYPEKTIRQALDCYKEGMSVSAIARAMETNRAAVYGWVKKAQEAMTAMGMERERRNPSAADIPHSVKAMRGIDAERTAAMEESGRNLRFDFKVGERDLLTFHRLLRRLPSAERCRRDGHEALGCLPAGRRERGEGERSEPQQEAAARCGLG